MSVDPPRHIIPLRPLKIRRTKIHLYLVRPFQPDRSVHVVVHARPIDPHKGVRQTTAVVGEEERAGAELVSAADDVPGGNSRKTTTISSSWRVNRVVPAAVGIFEELAQIVEVPGGAESIPPRQTPRRVWLACRTYRIEVCIQSGRRRS
jgi:hypothetical protein